MSYYLNLTFIENVEENQLLKIAAEIHKKAKDPEIMKKIIGDNFHLLDSISRGRAPKFQDRYWVTVWLSTKFIYWPDYKLLAYLGNNVKIPNSTNVSFQNSSDTNYEYSTWNGIKIFEEIAEKYKNMKVELLPEFYSYFEDNTIEEQEYARRWLVYNDIHNMLNIFSYFYDENRFRERNRVFTYSDFTYEDMGTIGKILREVYAEENATIEKELQKMDKQD